MALLRIIRRLHLRDQVSLREISKRLEISRNTVMRYQRAETVEPAYADRRSPTSFDKYGFNLSAWFQTETTKSRKQLRVRWDLTGSTIESQPSPDSGRWISWRGSTLQENQHLKLKVH